MQPNAKQPGATIDTLKALKLYGMALGIRNAFLNQPVEVGSIRPQFASALGLGNARPDLVVRFGHGPAMPLSMRRPVQAVLV